MKKFLLLIGFILISTYLSKSIAQTNNTFADTQKMKDHLCSKSLLETQGLTSLLASFNTYLFSTFPGDEPASVDSLKYIKETMTYIENRKEQHIYNPLTGSTVQVFTRKTHNIEGDTTVKSYIDTVIDKGNTQLLLNDRNLFGRQVEMVPAGFSVYRKFQTFIYDNLVYLSGINKSNIRTTTFEEIILNVCGFKMQTSSHL